jgi:AraC-like DNA-binding protein
MLTSNHKPPRLKQVAQAEAMSTRAISGQLGFPDVSSFGRKFRHWFGDSPGHFRRSRP